MGECTGCIFAKQVLPDKGQLSGTAGGSPWPEGLAGWRAAEFMAQTHQLRFCLGRKKQRRRWEGLAKSESPGIGFTLKSTWP